MPPPSATEYNEVIQNLHALSGDDELRGGQVVCNRRGFPAPYAGNFADVYQVRCARRAVAVKCFKTSTPGLRQRYREISAHLKRVRLGFLVDFDYVEQGLRINGTWHPVLKMDWVEGGIGLNQFVHQHVDRPSMLRDLLTLWVRVADRLGQAEVTRADLQHGNVLLVPVEGTRQLSLKLVDYDGMYVSSLAGIPSGELGHPAYQHPQRLREKVYSPHVDRFSHLVIYSAIRAVIPGGRPLWERFNNQENLLFREADFAEPSQSEVFRELWTLRDPEARALAGHLTLATQQPLEDVPALRNLLEGEIIRPLTVTEEARVAALLQRGRTVGALPVTGHPAWWNTDDVKDGPGRVERIDLISGEPDLAPSSTGTVSAAGSHTLGTRPEVAPAVPRRSTHEPVPATAPAATDSLTLLLRPVAWVDRGLAFVAGPGNEILHNFFRVVVVVASLLPMFIVPGLAYHFHALRQASGRELEEAREAWTSAWNLADQEWLVRYAPEASQSVEEMAKLAASLLEEENIPAATAAYREAVDLVAQATAEAERIEKELDDALNAWTTALQSGDQSLLRKHGGASHAAAEQQAALAERLVASNDITRAIATYREAGDLLRQALADAHQAMNSFYAREASQHQETWANHLGESVEVTNSIGMRLRLIPPGEFLMGSPADESNRDNRERRHEVRITRPYYLGVYEVTQGEYQRVMGANPSRFSTVSGEDTSRFPVENVSWTDAVEFCRRLSALQEEQSAGREYRLPTEAEWEYACRAGTTTPFHFGSQLNGQEANITVPSLRRTTTVGSYAPNGFGLYDMHGNVREWCADWYGAYPVELVVDPTGPTTGSLRVSRGGSWSNGARYCRAADRSWRSPGDRYGDLGFRVAFSSVDGSGV